MVAALALPFAVSACYAMSIHARTNTRLQDIADNAALAGVNSLASNTDQPADARSAAAIAAARTIIATQPGIVQKLQPSVEELTMSVVVEDIDKGPGLAPARYIPAKDSQPGQQPSTRADIPPPRFDEVLRHVALGAARRPTSNSHAAFQRIRSAACSAILARARGNCTPWLTPIGWPNTRARCA